MKNAIIRRLIIGFMAAALAVSAAGGAFSQGKGHGKHGGDERGNGGGENRGNGNGNGHGKHSGDEGGRGQTRLPVYQPQQQRAVILAQRGGNGPGKGKGQGPDES